jgi:uncharacterized oxidoreductase
VKIANRTVLIVGGTAGIGRGLAQRFAEAGSTVIVGGRSPELEGGLEAVRIDVTDPDSVLGARDEVLGAHPGLDVVVTMSGVLLTEDLRDPAHIAAAEATISTNLLGTIRVIDAFTPHLIARGSGAILTVSSGIAFLPFPLMATYGASKAGVHSKLNPAAVPVDEYLDEVMKLLTEEPTAREIIVKDALALRWAERDGTYAELLERRSAPLQSLPGR